MKKSNHIICLSLLISSIFSCIPYDSYKNHWHRGKRASTFFEKSYTPIDSISINRIVICKQQNKNIGERFKTKGLLNISVKDVEKELIANLKKSFSHVHYELKNDTIGSFNCNYLTRKNIFSGNYDKFLRKTNDYNAEITLSMLSTSSRETSLNFDGGGRTVILDRDRHHIMSTLRLAILKKNHLVYMNNYIHSETIYSEHDEDVNYKINKGVIDTLVTKCINEYNERLE